MVEKTAAFRQRRAADTARWRERLQRGACVLPVEADATTFDLMERPALGKLLRLALAVAAGGSCFPALAVSS
jgi:hypothetical protein